MRTGVPMGEPVPDFAAPAEPTPDQATEGGTPAVAAAEPAAAAQPTATAEPVPTAEPPASYADSPAHAEFAASTPAAAETVPLAHTTPGPDAQPVSGPDQAVESIAPIEPGVAAEHLVAAEPVAAEPAAVAATSPGADATTVPDATTATGAPAEAAAGAPPQAPRPPKPSNDERRARAQQSWERVLAAKESGEVLSGTVTSAVKGGLLVDVDGIRGFLPASQTRVPQGGTIEALVKTKVPLKVIDVDNDRRRIVVSQRRAMQEERGAKRRELLRELAVGQVREGVVVRLADFGAFVDLGGIDGLVPMRELAFERVEKVGDVLKVGEKLNVEVLRIEEGGKKISLSRKNALPDPWRDHAKALQRGSTIEGKVISKERGLSVEIAPGVVGNVREDEINPDDYAIGETVEVSVRNVDRVRRRINLTTLHGAQATAIASAAPSASSSGFAPLGAELLNPKPSNRGRRR